eukprot:TRINITY_DN9140_c0_g1_i7.p1 TRINITY_DN9140_c0_g1~~TRINITY_DN9140_c0_g1_i7.p1  ORF type:complete len:288 (-),score=53.02 TRINITY_DN9140_c0_g1_i7:217-1020(-)
MCIRDSSTTRTVFELHGVDKYVTPERAQMVRAWVNQIVGPEVEQGFAMAFDSLLSGLEDKDTDFLANILEPRLLRAVSDNIDDLESQGLHYKVNEHELEDHEVSYGAVHTIYGASFRRDKNPPSSSAMFQSMKLNDAIDIRLYVSKDLMSGGMGVGAMALTPFLQVEVYIKSSKKVYLADSTGKLVRGETGMASQYHKLLFENENQDEGKNLMRTMSRMGMAFQGLGAMGGDQKKIAEFVRNLLLGEKYVWKITDIDNYLRGNPHLS